MSTAPRHDVTDDAADAPPPLKRLRVTDAAPAAAEHHPLCVSAADILGPAAAPESPIVAVAAAALAAVDWTCVMRLVGELTQISYNRAQCEQGALRFCRFLVLKTLVARRAGGSDAVDALFASSAIQVVWQACTMLPTVYAAICGSLLGPGRLFPYSPLAACWRRTPEQQAAAAQNLRLLYAQTFGTAAPAVVGQAVPARRLSRMVLAPVAAVPAVAAPAAPVAVAAPAAPVAVAAPAASVVQIRTDAGATMSVLRNAPLPPPKVYACRMCDKVWHTPAHRERHENVHKNVRPCKCVLCPYAAATPHHLSRHVHSKHPDAVAAAVAVVSPCPSP